ncbi:OmpA family protein [Corallococcus llansteffanensis]|uniref:DUF937 domain-containing protein n=1 Tax=Corallococcus llansteffanensis TaxID=2316731 RepID=A0A3A8NDN8_9BACT|nr:OmpA family protein [Corallococcus llansteffanensis]RKH40311.1 DUF937 domain-containing protein [Corallococcus llansteffanensis]
MAFNLIEAVGSQFMKAGLLPKISGALGEDPQATTKALPGATAAVAAGVVDQGSNEAGAHRLLSKLNEGGFTGPDAPSRGDATDAGLLDEETRGKGMLSGLFGNKLEGVAEGLSRVGGMRDSGSAMRLLSLVAPMVMGVLGKQVRDQRLGATGLMQLLSSQRSHIAGALPAGLGSVLGIGGGLRHAPVEILEPPRATVAPVREDPVRETLPRQTATPPPPERKTSIAGWAIPLALLALIVLAWGALRGRRNEPAQAPRVTSNAVPPATGGSGPAKSRVSDASGLRTAFEDESAKQGIVLEGVEFANGSAQLTGTSQQRVTELGTVLKEKPEARVRITAFTDSAGDANANRKLSRTRAESVRDALVRDGVAAQRIEVSGAGNSNPLATNDTPEGRELNRRIEVQVLGQ